MKTIRYALVLAGLAAPAMLVATAAPVAAQPGTDVNGWNTNYVQFGGGYYARQSDGSWAEYNTRGQVTFRFVEVQRDEWSVYLNDPSRNVQVQLDLFRRKVSYGTNGGQRSDLYDITGARRPDSPAYRPTPTPTPAPAANTRPVNAGPIWNQQDAAVKCPVAAHAVGGRWTGGWWTTQQGQMSVCEIAF